jgi:hypothetical protein
MTIRHSHICALIVGGALLLSGGVSDADQSKSGSTSGGATMGSGSGGSMKQGHDSSSKTGQDSSVITKDNPGGIVTRGGRGEMPSDSKVDPLSTDQRESGSGFSPEINVGAEKSSAVRDQEGAGGK